MSDRLYDLFVLHDNDAEIILQQLTIENIQFCTIDRNGTEGRCLFSTAFDLANQAKRILCVVSKDFVENGILKRMAKSACTEPTIDDRIITLLFNVKLSRTNGLNCLLSNPVIQYDDNWTTNLKDELTTIIPQYCIYQKTRGVSSMAFSKGVLLQQMDFDLYGVLIKARNKNFLVKMVEFSKHLDKHSELSIQQACEDCGFLCDLDTTVSLGFTDDFLFQENTNFEETDISTSLLELMKCVMDAYNPHCKSNLWSVSCSVFGQYKPSHATFINNMFGSVVYALLNKAASKMGVPFLPEFEDIEKRRESMMFVEAEEQKKEEVAAAGFVCIAKPDRMQCFQCGWHIPLSAMDLDPLMYHASYMPLCPYIQKILSKGHLPRARVHHKKFDNSELSTENDGNEDFQKFADAGFYKNGFEHIMECISCGLCIIYNNTDTSPWDTHALLSPTCKFLLEKKGEDFIKSVNAHRASEQEATIVTYALTDFTFNHRNNWPGILFTPDTI